MKDGSRTTFNKQLAVTICERMASGEPLRGVCRELGVLPSTAVMWKRYKKFSEQYEQARQRQIDVYTAKWNSPHWRPPESLPRQIARAWGTSAAYVYKVKKKGCPVDSVEAAIKWRSENKKRTNNRKKII